MTLTDLIRRPFYAPQDDAGASPADPLAGDPPADPPAGDPPAAPEPKWWEGDALTDAQRTHLTHKGLTVDDPIEAAAKLADMHANAERHLGKRPEEILTRPGKDQDVAAWMRENAEVFGLPDSPEKYDLAEIEAGLPDGVQMDTEMLDAARQAAFEHGVPPKAMAAMAKVYADKVSGMFQAAQAELQASTQDMMTELQRDWGDQTNAKIDQAKQAIGALGEKAGLDPDALQAMAATLSAKAGDANVIRTFAALGEMLGEDTLAGVGRGAASLSMTPADARAELAKLQSPGGAYYEAVADGQTTKIQQLQPEIMRLTKIAAGGR